MKIGQLVCLFLLLLVQPVYARQTNNKKEISRIIAAYSQSVMEKDSVTFYSLFNDGVVTRCSAQG